MDAKTEYLRLVGILKDRRKLLKITQEEMATKMEVTRHQIMRWEKGHQPPEFETVIKWADYLDLKITITEK